MVFSLFEKLAYCYLFPSASVFQHSLSSTHCWFVKRPLGCRKWRNQHCTTSSLTMFLNLFQIMSGSVTQSLDWACEASNGLGRHFFFLPVMSSTGITCNFSFIPIRCQLLEQGNDQGIWIITISPFPLITKSHTYKECALAELFCVASWCRFFCTDFLYPLSSCVQKPVEFAYWDLTYLHQGDCGFIWIYPPGYF